MSYRLLILSCHSLGFISALGFSVFFSGVGVHLFASLHHYHEKIVVPALQSSAAADSAAFAEAGGADVGSPWWCPTREF